MFTRICEKEQIPLELDSYLKKINKIRKYTYWRLWQTSWSFLFVLLLVFALQIQSFYVLFFLSLGHCNANLNIFPMLGNLHLWNLNHCETQENYIVNILMCASRHRLESPIMKNSNIQKCHRFVFYLVFYSFKSTVFSSFVF